VYTTGLLTLPLSRVIPASYTNRAQRIHIPGLPPQLVPGSPEDIQIPVPPSNLPSGAVSPMSGLGTPRGGGSGDQTPENGGALPLRTRPTNGTGSLGEMVKEATNVDGEGKSTPAQGQEANGSLPIPRLEVPKS
jgi:hypothetical protein